MEPEVSWRTEKLGHKYNGPTKYFHSIYFLLRYELRRTLTIKSSKNCGCKLPTWMHKCMKQPFCSHRGVQIINTMNRLLGTPQWEKKGTLTEGTQRDKVTQFPPSEPRVPHCQSATCTQNRPIWNACSTTQRQTIPISLSPLSNGLSSNLNPAHFLHVIISIECSFHVNEQRWLVQFILVEHFDWNLGGASFTRLILITRGLWAHYSKTLRSCSCHVSERPLGMRWVYLCHGIVISDISKQTGYCTYLSTIPMGFPVKNLNKELDFWFVVALYCST